MMIPLKVTLHNSGKQKIAKFSINHAIDSNFILDKNAVRGITQVCVATLEMAQDNMVFDLSSIPETLQASLVDILRQEIDLAINKKQLFTASTKPILYCAVESKFTLDCNDLLDTNAELMPRAAF